MSIAEATAAVDAAEADLAAAKSAAMLADRAYRETLTADAVDPVALAWARGERDGARNAVRDAEARLASARNDHAAALAAQRTAEAHDAARLAEEARRADHEARVAPYVAALDDALVIIEEAGREVMRVASVVFNPAEVMRIEHADARARLLNAAHEAAPFVTAVARGELAGEDAAEAADALVAIDPTHPALAPARLAIAATSKTIVFEQAIKLAGLVGRSDTPHAPPVARARAAIEELAFSRKTGRWWTGDGAARERDLRAIIAPGVAFVVEQIPAQIRPWAPRGPFFVSTGGTQRQEIPQNRPQLRTSDGDLRNAFGPPTTPREQVIAFLKLEEPEHDLVPDIVAPFVGATAA